MNLWLPYHVELRVVAHLLRLYIRHCLAPLALFLQGAPRSSLASLDDINRMRGPTFLLKEAAEVPLMGR